MTMIEVEFWMGPEKTRRHLVKQDDLDACYALPKAADKFAYWRKVTGDQSIVGPILVWSTVEKKKE